MPNVFGPHLKKFREQQGIKAAYVAYKIRVSPPTYSEIESGKRGLSAERLHSILLNINLSMEELEALVYDKAKTAKNRSHNRKCQAM